MNMSVKLKSTILFFIIIISISVNAQKNSDIVFSASSAYNRKPIDPESFDTHRLEDLLFFKINEVLKLRGKETYKENEILKDAALNQARYMADYEEKTLIQKNSSLETTGIRLRQFGGSTQAEEIILRSAFKKGNNFLSYDQLANSLVLSIFNSGKYSKIVQDRGLNIIGTGADMDENLRKVYVSIVLGNFKSMNEGAKLKSRLKIPYSEDLHGIKPYNIKECRKIDRTRNLHDLQKNLVVEDNIIYYDTKNSKLLARLLRENTDGLAVDILQKAQFPCDTLNIIDYNTPNRGILTKRVYSNKLFKNNLINTEKRKNRYALKTELGTIPEGIEDYELNLVFIKNKTFCKSIAPSFLIKTSGTYARKVELLADTITRFTEVKYQPIADSIERDLKIPFECSKADYKTEDIKPFINMLNEPAFIIYELNIHAFSSIEGDHEENEALQQARANSIVEAIKGLQQDSIATNIKKDYNWNKFKQDIKQTKFKKAMDTMDMAQAQKFIRDNNLNKQLEPILANHRYATINIKAIHDITGIHEPPHVLRDFDKAIENSEYDLALAIQKFIIQKINSNEYNISNLERIELPLEQPYAGMIMNQTYVLYKQDRITTEEFISTVDTLSKIDEENEYIKFNYLLNTINYNDLKYLVDNNTTIQNEIDRLYYTPLQQKTIDGLNIRYQFKLINTPDSILKDEKLREDCRKKIKDIVKIKEETLSNSLKLAEVFIENEDYDFARESLALWVKKTYSERLIFTYISLCSLDEKYMHTENFTLAMEKALKINPKRYCDLFKKGGFSLRVLENKKVKATYCKSCLQ